MFPILLALLACGESEPSSPPAAPPAPAAAAPEAPVEPAAVEPTEEPAPDEAAAAEPPPLPEGIDARLVEVLGEDLVRRMLVVGQAQADARDQAALAAAWNATAAWAEEAETPLQAWWDAQGGSADTAWLDAALPGLEAGIYAEGTALVVQHKQSTWSALARETPETDDDSVFAMTSVAWDNASGDGWPRWGERTWDYGGCSILGSGAHLEILKRIAHAKGAPAPWDGLVAKTREGVLKDILEDNAEFPYCDPTTSQPRPVKQIRLEVQAILSRIELSEAERAALQARLDTTFAEPG